MKLQSAAEMIREDHKKVDQLYQRYNGLEDKVGTSKL